MKLGGERFKQHKINRYFHQGQPATPDDEAVIAAKVKLVSPELSVGEIVAEYRGMRGVFGNEPQHNELALIDHGDSFVNLMPLLRGCWRVFYYAPLDRDARPKLGVHSFVAFFRASEEDTRMSTFAISGNTDWIGFSALNGQRISVWLSEKEKSAEVALFNCSVPTKFHNYMSGIVLALSRVNPGKARSTVATLCVAERIVPVQIATQARPRPILSTEALEAAKTATEAYFSSEEIAEPVRSVLRQHFCKTFDDVADFEKAFPNIAQYADELEINGGALPRTTSLYLS